MINKNKFEIENELKNKIYFLQKALEECSEIIKIIDKKYNTDAKLYEKITPEKNQDLTKIRGD
jgi:hypothetical protein